MSDFYTILSEHYDALFKSTPMKLDFLVAGFKAEGGAVLDIGAATGTFSLPLAARGYQVTAVDYDQQMVARMQEKAVLAGLEQRHEGLVGDMREILKVQDRGPFGRMYCIGNTLPHLTSEEEVLSFLTSCKAMLADGGRLVLQTVNYDRIVNLLEAEDAFVFPPLAVENTDLLFCRRYHLFSKADLSKVIFEARFESRSGAASPVGSTTLLALRGARLQELLEKAGFATTQLYGDFDGRAFVEDESPALVAVAFK